MSACNRKKNRKVQHYTISNQLKYDHKHSVTYFLLSSAQIRTHCQHLSQVNLHFQMKSC